MSILQNYKIYNHGKGLLKKKKKLFNHRETDFYTLIGLNKELAQFFWLNKEIAQFFFLLNKELDEPAFSREGDKADFYYSLLIIIRPMYIYHALTVQLNQGLN